MEPSDLLRIAVCVLEDLRLPYLVTGSMATIHYGEPRFTNDIDIVVSLPASEVSAFCERFAAPEYYVSVEAAREAVTHGSQFNIIHPDSGLKVDVMIAQNTPFDRIRFSRAVRVRPASDYDARFASPEDVIIKKLEYYRDGGSDKHLRDITGVLKVSGERVDRAYVQEWAERLGLASIWQAIVQAADP